MVKFEETADPLFNEKRSHNFILVHDFLEKIGGAEYVFRAFLLKLKVKQIFTLSYKNYVAKKVAGHNIKVISIIPHFLIFLYRRLPRLGKLFIIVINFVASFQLKKLSTLNTKNMLINTSSLLPTAEFQANIYYNIFPTWYLSSPKSYLKDMPFLLKFLYNLLMVPYQSLIFKAITSSKFNILTNSTFTAYMFYKFWQVHTYIFLPVFIYKNKNSDLPQITQSTSTLSNKSCYAYIGRLDKGKRLEQLVEALPSNKCLLLIGAGELEHKLKELSLRLKKQVIFQGWVEHSKLPQYLKQIKGLINFNYEAFGLTFFEALSYNKPVLGNIFSGLYDIAKINVHFIQYKENMPLYKQLGQLEKLPMFDYNTIKGKLIKSFKIN